MSNQLSFILLLPLVLWATFQGLLYVHAGQVQETVTLAAFEGQKEASLQGYYSDELLDDMKNFLVEGYNMDPDKISITVTDENNNPLNASNRQYREERMRVCVSIPSPIIHVLDIFDFSGDGGDAPCGQETSEEKYYRVEKEIMSEFVDGGEAI
jgi:alanyl-tRNA synthetase